MLDKKLKMKFRFIILLGITAIIGCSKEVAVLPIVKPQTLNGVWTIDSVEDSFTKQSDTLLYGINYKWIINKDTLSVVGKNKTSTYWFQKIDSAHYNLIGNEFPIYSSVFEVKHIGNKILINTIREYDLFVCGVKEVRGISFPLALRLKQ